MRVLSSELAAHVGERVTLAGWVHANRELGAVSFVVIRDRCGIAQVVLSAATPQLGSAFRAREQRGGRCRTPRTRSRPTTSLRAALGGASPTQPTATDRWRSVARRGPCDASRFSTKPPDV